MLTETPLGKWVWREELMAKALEVWSREVIEEALGADAVLPHAARLAELRARIPRYQLAMLNYLAEQQQTTVSDVLTRGVRRGAGVARWRKPADSLLRRTARRGDAAYRCHCAARVATTVLDGAP